MRVNQEALGFEWDKGNTGKNKGHGVEDNEAEEVFFDERKVILDDILHSRNEPRFVLLGKTRKGRLLVVVFTIRSQKVRIISARDVNKKEKQLYEKTS